MSEIDRWYLVMFEWSRTACVLAVAVLHLALRWQPRGCKVQAKNRQPLKFNRRPRDAGEPSYPFQSPASLCNGRPL